MEVSEHEPKPDLRLASELLDLHESDQVFELLSVFPELNAASSLDAPTLKVGPLVCVLKQVQTRLYVHF